MEKYVLTEDDISGYGTSREEALEDLFFNKCKKSIDYDTEGVFKRRRDILKPWMPRPNMLHIHTVGCLLYQNGILVETSTGKSVNITGSVKSIYYYIAKLFGKKLSFTDITIVLRKELDSLFKSISDDFVLIKNTPDIKLMNRTEGFDPIVTYNTKQSLIIGTSKRALGVKEVGEDYFRVVEFEGLDVDMELLSYVCYRLGYVYDGIDIVEIEG